MLSRLFDRSVRWLTASLAVVALVTALAVPVQAAPRGESGNSELRVELIERLADWLGGLVSSFWPRPIEAPNEPQSSDSISAATGVCTIDPLGNPINCPEDD